MWIWPDKYLNHSDVFLWTQNVPMYQNVSKMEQSAAALLIIWQIYVPFAGATSYCLVNEWTEVHQIKRGHGPIIGAPNAYFIFQKPEIASFRN